MPRSFVLHLTRTPDWFQNHRFDNDSNSGEDGGESQNTTNGHDNPLSSTQGRPSSSSTHDQITLAQPRILGGMQSRLVSPEVTQARVTRSGASSNPAAPSCIAGPSGHSRPRPPKRSLIGDTTMAGPSSKAARVAGKASRGSITTSNTTLIGGNSRSGNGATGPVSYLGVILLYVVNLRL